MPAWGAAPTSFVLNLFFAGQLWWLNIAPGSDLPYWSICYEVWYYTIFGLILFGGVYRVLAATGAALIAGPNIIALFPLWLLGVLTYRICARQRFSPWTGGALVTISLVTWMAWEVLARRYHLQHIGPMYWVQRDQLPKDYIISTLFAAHLIGFVAISQFALPVLERFARLIRWAAGATFTIYLLHWPVAQFLTTVVPWEPDAWQTRVVMFPGVLLIVFSAAACTERRKAAWRAVFASCLGQTKTPAI